LDSFRASRIGLILAGVNMALLLVWFFLARVTIYEVSDKINFVGDGHVIAIFQPEIVERIRPGQSALLRLEVDPEQAAITIPALVVGTERGGNQVELLVMLNDPALKTLQGKQPGQVDVEIEYITPVRLVMRASGKFLNSAQVPLSPQSLPDANDSQ
jgi:hypothetical protein